MQVRRLVISLAVAALVIAGLAWPRAQAATWGKAAQEKGRGRRRKRIISSPNTSGPWLIMAATFTGDGAEDQARQLVRELRKELKQNAYTYQKKFDFSKTDRRTRRRPLGRTATDALPARRAGRGDRGPGRRLRAGGRCHRRRKTLKQIKYMKPDALIKVEKTSQTMAAIHAIQKAAIPHDEKQPEKGPMGGAFLTTNPLLPRDYFVPKGLDKFVVDMNKGRQAQPAQLQRTIHRQSGHVHRPERLAHPQGDRSIGQGRNA